MKRLSDRIRYLLWIHGLMKLNGLSFVDVVAAQHRELGQQEMLLHCMPALRAGWDA